MTTHKGIFKNSELDKIQEKLKFIGTLEPGQKISVGSSPVIQENTYWTSMVRTFTGESRQRVFKFIQDTISDSLNILEGLSNSSNDFDIQICKNLITDLIFLKPGLTNLQATYKLDRMYVSKIKVLMENLDVKIRELCYKRDIDYDQLYEKVSTVIKERQENADSELAKVVTKQEEEVATDNLGGSDSHDDDEDQSKEKDDEDEEKKKSDNKSTMSDEGSVDIIPTLLEEEKKEETKEETKIEDNVQRITLDRNKLLPTYSQPPSRLPPLPPSTDESDSLVSFLRTLPSEDLLLMSTQQDPTQGTGPSSTGGRQGRRKRKQKHAYQYDTYYMSPPDDITLCNSDLEKGIIR